MLLAEIRLEIMSEAERDRLVFRVTFQSGAVVARENKAYAIMPWREINGGYAPHITDVIMGFVGRFEIQWEEVGVIHAALMDVRTCISLHVLRDVCMKAAQPVVVHSNVEYFADLALENCLYMAGIAGRFGRGWIHR